MAIPPPTIHVNETQIERGSPPTGHLEHGLSIVEAVYRDEDPREPEPVTSGGDWQSGYSITMTWQPDGGTAITLSGAIEGEETGDLIDGLRRKANTKSEGVARVDLSSSGSPPAKRAVSAPTPGRWTVEQTCRIVFQLGAKGPYSYGFIDSNHDITIDNGSLQELKTQASS